MLWILGIYIWIENLLVFFNVCTIELLLTFTSALLYHFQPYVLWLAASSWDLASVAWTKKDALCLCLAIPCLSQLWVAWYSFLDFLPAMELNRLVTGFIAQQHYSSEKIGLCLMKSSSKILQNLPYFYPHSSFHASLFSLLGKNKVGWNEKQKKQFWVFIYIYKIWQILKRFAGTFHQA